MTAPFCDGVADHGNSDKTKSWNLDQYLNSKTSMTEKLIARSSAGVAGVDTKTPEARRDDMRMFLDGWQREWDGKKGDAS